MALDAAKNFAIVTVSTGYDASDTAIVLLTGDGGKLPQPSTDGNFNLVWWNDTDYPNVADDPNMEIVRCTVRLGDTITISRGQEGTTATNKNTASKIYRMALVITKKMIDDIKSYIEPEHNIDGTHKDGIITDLYVEHNADGMHILGLIQTVEGTPYTSPASTTAVIPFDNSIPQNTEGLELVGDATITPKSATNRLRIVASLPFLSISGSNVVIATIFQDSAADAKAVAVFSDSATGVMASLHFYHEMAAGTTNPTTFKLRLGVSSGTIYVNQSNNGITLGSISAVRLSVSEIGV